MRNEYYVDQNLNELPNNIMSFKSFRENEGCPLEATPCLEFIKLGFDTLLVVLLGLLVVVIAAVVVVVVVRNSAQEPSLVAISGGRPSHTTMSRPQGVYRCWILESN